VGAGKKLMMIEEEVMAVTLESHPLFLSNGNKLQLTDTDPEFFPDHTGR
jgi:hypothetical protein